MNENPIIFSNLSEILSKVNLSKLFSSSKQSDKTTLQEKVEIDFLPNLSGRVAGNGWNGWKWLEMSGNGWNGWKWLEMAGNGLNGWNGWK